MALGYRMVPCPYTNSWWRNAQQATSRGSILGHLSPTHTINSVLLPNTVLRTLNLLSAPGKAKPIKKTLRSALIKEIGLLKKKCTRMACLASSLTQSSFFSSLLALSFPTRWTSKCSAAAETQAGVGAAEVESGEKKLGHRTYHWRTL